ncbi:MFS transporter [Thalassotalea sp. HSM 43]|uniref:MFS transporter n=1 Tax=Thalassotalea sp. HSM 43 TaxID=2552945 RepID=UPI00108219BE|nr:MFS transporter [Thalassotalea sp. HSM 43]QBY04573.1 MFS transporter [Thalassotalea sp. HSM 43]
MQSQTAIIEPNSGSKVLHWTMVIIAMCCLLISNGMVLTGLTAFDSAMLAEFSDWSRGDLKMRGLITLALTGLLAPFIGILIDRIGVKVLMMFGAVVLGASYYAYGMITDISHMYYIHAAFAVVLVACGLNVAVILVSNWFVTMRGTAIGIAVMGTSLGGAILAPLFGSWISEGMSWRDAFQMASAIPAVLFLIALFLVKNRPADCNKKPMGYETLKDSSDADVSSQGMEYIDAIKTKSFWAIALIAMFTFYTLLGLQANLVLHLQDLGFEIQSAAAGLAMLFTPALIGKFLFGLIADKVKGKRVLYGNLGLMLLGLIALYFAGKDTVLWTVAIIGFAWGGFYTLLQLNAVNNFGLKASGKLLGTITVLDALGGGLGIFLTGKFFDMYGSYQNAFMVFIVLVVISLGLIGFIKKHVD